MISVDKLLGVVKVKSVGNLRYDSGTSGFVADAYLAGGSSLTFGIESETPAQKMWDCYKAGKFDFDPEDEFQNEGAFACFRRTPQKEDFVYPLDLCLGLNKEIEEIDFPPVGATSC